MPTEMPIASTLQSKPTAVATSAAAAQIACTDYPYMLVRMMDLTVPGRTPAGGAGGAYAAMGMALVRMRARVGRWLARRRLDRAVARARVVARGGGRFPRW